MILRRQLPAYSPLSAASIRQAIVHGLGPGMDGQAELSESLESKYAADQAVLLGSGTQALQVAIELAMRQVGDVAIALPAFTCFDVATAAVGARARIRFYDVDPSTLAPDLRSLERVLKRGTRIAVITPLYGFPVDWDAVADLLAPHGAIAVEDAAQGDHAEWRGRILGSLGPISVLSFGRGKGWTGGNGGALLVREQPPWGDLREAVAEMSARWNRRAAEVRVLGALAAQWALGRPECYAIPRALPWLHLGETVYRDPVSPRPMTRATSACLSATRVPAAREAVARRETAVALLEAIGSWSRVRPIRPLAGGTPGYLRLPLRLARGLAGFPQPAAATRLGLARSYPSILPAIPQIRPWVDDTTTGWPGAEELVRRLCTAPTHSLVTGPERAELIQQLQAYERRE
jgi:perosamine synthetase